MLFGPDGIRATASGGLASIEHGIPFKPETPSRYASISKQFMAATLLLQGVDLSRTLGALIPDFDGPLSEVTLARALDMTGGLPDMMEALWQVGVPFTATLSAATIMNALRRLPGLCAPPGTEMAYCNTGWRLAQSVIAARCGAEYGTVLDRTLLHPLASPITFPADETEIVPGLATGYWQDGNTWRRGRYGMHFSASGGLAGSANALAAWGTALLAGTHPGLLDALAAPRTLADGTPSPYRLGLIESHLGPARLLGHGGSLPGYRNALLLAPEHGCGVVYLTNRDADALLPALSIMAALVGEAAPAPASHGPTGLYATADGPFWVELTPGAMVFMGAGETLLESNDGLHRSPPSSLELEIRAEPEALHARIGGVTRHLAAVPPGLPIDKALVGTWRNDAFNAVLSITADSTTQGTIMFPSPGGLGHPTTLTPLPGPRAIVTLPHGPWQHRPCLNLLPDGQLQVASHRSRALRFHPI